MTYREPFTFEYALRFPDGRFYTGRANTDAQPEYWKGTKHEAYTYTEAGAYAKRDRMSCFALCEVVRII